MKMSIGEKKILFVFGCPNRESTVDRLYQVAHLIPDPAARKAVEALAEKLDSEGVEKWYRCFFYNMKLEMEAYYRHKAILNRIVGGSMEVDNDEIDEDSTKNGCRSSSGVCGAYCCSHFWRRWKYSHKTL